MCCSCIIKSSAHTALSFTLLNQEHGIRGFFFQIHSRNEQPESMSACCGSVSKHGTSPHCLARRCAAALQNANHAPVSRTSSFRRLTRGEVGRHAQPSLSDCLRVASCPRLFGGERRPGSRCETLVRRKPACNHC